MDGRIIINIFYQLSPCQLGAFQIIPIRPMANCLINAQLFRLNMNVHLKNKPILVSVSNVIFSANILYIYIYIYIYTQATKIGEEATQICTEQKHSALVD